MSYVAVLPSIHQPWTDRCLASCRLDVLVIDNTVRNRGVSASWNLGIDAMNAEGADWLVIMSAALRFGAPGGTDFLAALDTATDRVAVEAAHGIGWHLIAFPRWVIDRVGRFDENCFAYYEDVDWSHRVALAFGLDPPYWEKVDCDVAIAGFAHGMRLGGAVVDAPAIRRYMRKKWGSEPGDAPGYDHPFNDAANDLGYWPAPAPVP